MSSRNAHPQEKVCPDDETEHLASQRAQHVLIPTSGLARTLKAPLTTLLSTILFSLSVSVLVIILKIHPIRQIRL